MPYSEPVLCRRCRETKSASEFNKNSTRSNGLAHWCRACVKAHYKENPRSPRTQDQRDHRYKMDLERRYGLTVEDYQRIFLLQDGCCAICERKPSENRRLSLDHDHSCCAGTRSCGKCVRGLLCDSCNHKVLGMWLRESVDPFRALEIARRLVSYMEDHS